jgi:putative membrane protein
MERKHIALIFLFFAGLIPSAIYPHDYFTWFLEVAPALIGFVILIKTFKKFRFTYFTYVMVLVHCYILFIGGHYTYAGVPLFDFIKDLFDQQRNNYDKVGHFAQGFVPALIVRELLLRQEAVKQGWVPFLTICVCLSISACYEFIEWLVSLISGSSGDSFLGTQGYVWDTQSDMLYAGMGATCAILLFSKLQDRQIEELETEITNHKHRNR